MKCRKMKSRKRKRESLRSEEHAQNGNKDCSAMNKNENYYGTLVKSNAQQCEFCDMVFRNRYDSLIHTARHIIIPLIKQSVHICKECLFCFTSQNELQNHVKIKHNTTLETIKLSAMIEGVVKTQVKIKCENLNLNLDAKLKYPSTSEVTLKKLGQIDASDNSRVPKINDVLKSPLPKDLPKDLPNHIPPMQMQTKETAPSVLVSLLNKDKQQTVNSLSNPTANNKTTPTVKLVTSETLANQQFLIQPAYLVPQSDPNMPNQIVYNQVFQIQPLPLMTSDFACSPLQQPFLSMIPNAIFNPQKSQEEEFILPDLEPTIRLVPSMQPVIQPPNISKPAQPTRQIKEPVHRPSPQTSILKHIERSNISNTEPTVPSNRSVLPHQPPKNNDITALRYTEASNNLINKSPLLVKQLLMKSPEMVSNIKSRIIFEEDDDDVICVTDLQPASNQTKPQEVSNIVTTQTNNHTSRCITIENGVITNELQKLNKDIQSLPITNGFSVTPSVHYDKLIQPGMYRCKRCPKIFPNRYEAIIHEAKSHLNIVTRVKGYHCPSCDYYIDRGSISGHSQKCQPSDDHKISSCTACGLKFSHKNRHDRIYHSIYRCRCGTVYKSLEEIQSHVNNSMCTTHSYAQLCEVCEIFVTRQAILKYEILSVTKKYGKKFKCSKCSSWVDEVKLLKFTKKVKSRIEDFSRDERTGKFGMIQKKRDKLKTNEKRLKSIQKRLKNITHMSKF